MGLTKRGWFQIRRLRLNRGPVIELRRQRGATERLRQLLDQNQQARVQLQEYVRELEEEIERLLDVIAEMTRP